MGSFSLAFTLFPQNDQVCPLRRPHLCLGLFGVLLPRTLTNQDYNYNYTSTLQKAPQKGGPTRTLPTQTCNHNHNYTSTPQKVPKEGSQTRTLPLQVYNYNHNYNYASTLQTVPKEGGQTRTLPLQVYNYNHTTPSTLQTVPKEGGPPRAKPLQTHNHNYNYSTTLQKIEEKRLPVSSHHQSQPVEASATYQALSSASITIRAAVAATILMTAQPPSLSNVIFLLVPSLVGRYSVSKICVLLIY